MRCAVRAKRDLSFHCARAVRSRSLSSESLQSSGPEKVFCAASKMRVWKWLVRYHEISIVYCSAVTARIVTGSGRACRKWRPPASHNAACSCENRNYSPAPLLSSLHMFSVLEGWECCGVRTMNLPCSGKRYFLAACPFSWFTYCTVITSSVGVNYREDAKRTLN